jgi:hypothetical protein
MFLHAHQAHRAVHKAPARYAVFFHEAIVEVRNCKSPSRLVSVLILFRKLNFHRDGADRQFQLENDES